MLLQLLLHLVQLYFQFSQFLLVHRQRNLHLITFTYNFGKLRIEFVIFSIVLNQVFTLERDLLINVFIGWHHLAHHFLILSKLLFNGLYLILIPLDISYSLSLFLQLLLLLADNTIFFSFHFCQFLRKLFRVIFIIRYYNLLQNIMNLIDLSLFFYILYCLLFALIHILQLDFS